MTFERTHTQYKLPVVPRTDIEAQQERVEVELLRLAELTRDPVAERIQREERARKAAQVAFDKQSVRGIPARMLVAFWRMIREVRG